ncbi:ComF family protein [Patescibacteria group bacterium]|nr:ComF family protein [Patescibacteria group bacterium]
MENLINLIFPQECFSCGKIGRILCVECLRKLSLSKIADKQICIVCGTYSKEGMTHEKCLKSKDNKAPRQLIYLFEYKDMVRKSVKESKYARKQFLALKYLTRWGIQECGFDFGYYTGFALVPVPISKKKMRRRGFNQARIIAREAAPLLGLKLNATCVTREKDTRAQYTKSRTERFKSLEGAFSVEGNYVRGRKILLVDDICTTGATLLEISKVLYEVGAQEVRCLCLSKAV